jgi:hypothetical protein
MQPIGKFSLRNQGGFVCKLQFVYWDQNGNRHHVDGTGSFPIGQSETADPGQYGVPNGSAISLYADVVWGNDNTASQMFTYQSGNATKADYVITGTTLDNQLALIDIS